MAVLRTGRGLAAGSSGTMTAAEAFACAPMVPSQRPQRQYVGKRDQCRWTRGATMTSIKAAAEQFLSAKRIAGRRDDPDARCTPEHGDADRIPVVRRPTSRLSICVHTQILSRLPQSPRPAPRHCGASPPHPGEPRDHHSAGRRIQGRNGHDSVGTARAALANQNAADPRYPGGLAGADTARARGAWLGSLGTVRVLRDERRQPRVGHTRHGQLQAPRAHDYR